MNSIRRTLLVSLLSAIVVVLGIGGYATYRTAHDEIDTVMDYNLRQFALSLRDQRFGQPAVSAPDAALDFVIQIWDGHGLRLYLSHPHSVLPDLARFGYTTIDTSDGQWRAFAMSLGDRVIQIAQPMRVRSRLAANAALRTLTPLLVALPLLGLLIWYLVGRGLRPLEQLARGVRAQRPEALGPLDAAGVPAEARPLVDALNGLLGRLEATLASQRAFVADAAHELRTPLTALQLQLQLTERARDAAEREQALADLRAGLMRSIHLVNQLLTLARAEPDADGASRHEPVDLAALVRSELPAHAPLAEARHIDLGAAELAEATVAADAAALRTLLANLVDNAIRYTPDGGRVDVAVAHEGGRAWLTVADSGPGIPPGERERVLDRFYRRAGTDTPGSGLGLAIVKRIAERHDAVLTLDASEAGGLRVRVGFRIQTGP
ncbi:two-component sensor histidine kinase [Nitrogeniibacter mangrovi]|uniref:histidine kinase n=1 Tax=Nitrogeniibacter mangrovi TaxID=2016596 RepID=A0A6C1B8I1_9RHOO|nr:ATP-binding protein [Nitrogeniibacter mangrovi]QID19259.1 two-component sensor histidine kinase [Nitrogeniibacter mangrovi]